MKTFKEIINEVAEPKGADEKRFKAKHVVAKYDHPAAEEDQFTPKKIKKDKSKPAGYHDGKDEEVYEEVSDQERLSARKIQRDAQTARHGIARKPGESMVAYLNRAKKHKEKMQKEEADVHTKRAGEIKVEGYVPEEAQPKWKARVGNKTYTVTARNTAEANSKAMKMAKREGNKGVPSGKIEKVSEGYVSDAQRKAVHASKDEQKKKKKSFKEMFSGQDLAEDPWEEVPMMTRQLEFICYAAQEIKEYASMTNDPEEWFQNKLAHVHGQMQSLHAYIEGDKRMMSAKMSDMNPMGEEVELDEAPGAKDVADDHGMDRGTRVSKKAWDRLKKTKKEEVELDEAFKMGSMKLKDGSTVKLSKEEAEAVNELFNELNSSNKKRMEEEMMKNKSGFDKVLKFAKEAM